MANYDWRDFQGLGWRQRFPDWSMGASIWREQPDMQRVTSDLFEERRALTSPVLHPRVFVSHRQADVDAALRIAYLACQQGFDYWLDVLDPNLAARPRIVLGFSQQQAAAAIAAIIEIALLNSTHVVAVMTQNTIVSQWVPYEYGRVKGPTPVTLQAAAGVASSLTRQVLPEYLHLGVITRTELDLKNWLKSEFT